MPARHTSGGMRSITMSLVRQVKEGAAVWAEWQAAVDAPRVAWVVMEAWVVKEDPVETVEPGGLQVVFPLDSQAVDLSITRPLATIGPAPAMPVAQVGLAGMVVMALHDSLLPLMDCPEMVEMAGGEAAGGAEPGSTRFQGTPPAVSPAV